MITIKLKGGLGNQMFQYATGRYLSIENKSDLFLYKDFENNTDTERNYELSEFNVNENLTDKFKSNFINKILRKFYFDYHPNFLNKLGQEISENKNVYLSGFFQSEKNFKSIRDILLKDFTLKEESKSDLFKEKSNQISNHPNSISLHVRRGDYAKNSKTNKYHGVCSPSYYKKAVDFIKEKTADGSRFYIFSDDINWVNTELLPELNIDAEIISSKGLSMQEEMILMSKCNHNIIANSSFSWWGAWLNQNNDKIVITPTPWVDKKPNPHPNILPEEWITLPKN